MLSLSKSKLGTWIYCPALFFRQYILNLEPYNPKFDFGGDVHKWVEMWHKRQERDFVRHYRTGEILEPKTEIVRNDEVIKPYIDIYPQDYFDVPAGEDVPFSDGIDLGRERYWKPTPLVERRYSITFNHPKTDRPLPLPMSLVIDGIRVQEKLLSDLKTASGSWNQKMADSDLQATIYLYAWWQMTGELWDFQFIPLRKRPGPRTKPIQDPIKTRRTVKDFATAWEQINDTAQQIVRATRYPCYCRDQKHVIKGITE